MFEYAKPEKKQVSKNTVQKKETDNKSAPNLTGIPNKIKTRFENLSEFSFDDVHVHYNLDKLAQLRTLAYTQGNKVYVSSWQEKHLNHELGHVVQQKQERVRATMSVSDVEVNDDSVLEHDADLMQFKGNERLGETSNVAQRVSKDDYVGEEKIKFIKIYTIIKEQARVDYIGVDSLLKNVTIENMNMILRWPLAYIKQLDWLSNVLDILKNPFKYQELGIVGKTLLDSGFDEVSSRFGNDYASAIIGALMSTDLSTYKNSGSPLVVTFINRIYKEVKGLDKNNVNELNGKMENFDNMRKKAGGSAKKAYFEELFSIIFNISLKLGESEEFKKWSKRTDIKEDVSSLYTSGCCGDTANALYGETVNTGNAQVTPVSAQVKNTTVYKSFIEELEKDNVEDKKVKLIRLNTNFGHALTIIIYKIENETYVEIIQSWFDGYTVTDFLEKRENLFALGEFIKYIKVLNSEINNKISKRLFNEKIDKLFDVEFYSTKIVESPPKSYAQDIIKKTM